MLEAAGDKRHENPCQRGDREDVANDGRDDDVQVWEQRQANPQVDL
jgi:hypothetical protein